MWSLSMRGPLQCERLACLRATTAISLSSIQNQHQRLPASSKICIVRQVDSVGGGEEVLFAMSRTASVASTIVRPANMPVRGSATPHQRHPRRPHHVLPQSVVVVERLHRRRPTPHVRRHEDPVSVMPSGPKMRSARPRADFCLRCAPSRKPSTSVAWLKSTR